MTDSKVTPNSTQTLDTTGGSRWVVQTGADLVHLVEELHARYFRLLLVLVAVGSPLSVWFAHLDHRQPSGPVTTTLAALSLSGSLLALRHPRSVYLWLRRTRLRQQLLGLTAALLVFVDGPYSPLWWVAFPLLSLMASVASGRLTLLWGAIAMSAAAATTLLHGASLLPGGDGRYLLAGVSLPLYGLFASGIGEWSGRFVLRLHQLERAIEQPLPPIRIASIQDPEPSEPADHHRAPTPRRRPGDPTRLTVRQLEVAMLLRDGLRQAEIADCLGISARQVERLVEEGRRRTGARTTSELVAKLINQRLAPEIG